MVNPMRAQVAGATDSKQLYLGPEPVTCDLQPETCQPPELSPGRSRLNLFIVKVSR